MSIIKGSLTPCLLIKLASWTKYKPLSIPVHIIATKKSCEMCVHLWSQECTMKEGKRRRIKKKKSEMRKILRPIPEIERGEGESS